MINRLNGIKKVEKFLWNKEKERDFVKLKKAFTEGEIQAFPDFGVGDPIILTTDWSKENIMGVLSQVQDRQVVSGTIWFYLHCDTQEREGE